MPQPKFLVTVMPDHGFETNDGTTTSANLQADFAGWTAQFEAFTEKPRFDWPEVHSAPPN